jgi:hypothetical protein
MTDEGFEVLQGTLDLMILKTLRALGPLHGFGIARRIEQVGGDVLGLNKGTYTLRSFGCSSKARLLQVGPFREQSTRPILLDHETRHETTRT